ncbi:uncharacterized protein LOC118436051 isoform X2 [Folsomia candida]|uniref:uncharacterized protein LOC118436051 isoform X2 n=1 Tax=Folsomia candida TaxID=158441 RepID=UPI001604C5D4|nr:uncharacterized protein LOC118436051 isoform X2 [Folsomia candida]
MGNWCSVFKRSVTKGNMDENNEAKDHWGPPLQTPDPNFRPMSIRRALRDRYKNVPDNGGFGEISWMSNESHERTVQSRPGTAKKVDPPTVPRGWQGTKPLVPERSSSLTPKSIKKNA